MDDETMARIAKTHNMEKVLLRMRIEELERALRHIIGMAGHPDAAEGCRNIIKRAKKALPIEL